MHSAIEGEKDTTVGRERGGGGTPDFKWQGWSNGGQKSKPKKFPGSNVNPHKIPFQICEAKFGGIFFFGELRCRHKSSDCFEYPKNPYLNQSTQENTRQFSYRKKFQNWNFQIQKNPLIIPITWNSPLGVLLNMGDHNGHSLECCRGQVLSLPLFILFFLFCPFTWTYNWGGLCSQLPYVKLKCIILPLVKKTQ